MFLDASVRGTIKIKIAWEVRELIDNIYLSEYHPHTDDEASSKKKGMIDLNTHDALPASNKILSIEIETISNTLEAKTLAQIPSKVSGCDCVYKLMQVVHAFWQVWDCQTCW